MMNSGRIYLCENTGPSYECIEWHRTRIRGCEQETSHQQQTGWRIKRRQEKILLNSYLSSATIICMIKPAKYENTKQRSVAQNFTQSISSVCEKTTWREREFPTTTHPSHTHQSNHVTPARYPVPRRAIHGEINCMQCRCEICAQMEHHICVQISVPTSIEFAGDANRVSWVQWPSQMHLFSSQSHSRTYTCS